MTPPPPIAVQLYGFRRQARDGLEGVLRRVAAMGYLGVEIAELHGVAPARVRELTDELGLKVVGLHTDTVDGVLGEAETLGAEAIIGGFDAFGSREEIVREADRLNRVAVQAAERGIAVAYHNHDPEFSTRVDGAVAYDLIMEALDPAIGAAVDAYWVQVGGGDPDQVLRSLGDRVRILHVKDGPAIAEDDVNVAVGAGRMNIPALIASSPAVAWHVVELDRCATDMFDAVQASYDYLVGNGFSRGGA